MSKTKPKAIAWAKSPLLVSKAIAVGILRVTSAILPPTIMEQPTSVKIRLKPATRAISKGTFNSLHKVQIDLSQEAPKVRDVSQALRSTLVKAA